MASNREQSKTSTNEQKQQQTLHNDTPIKQNLLSPNTTSTTISARRKSTLTTHGFFIDHSNVRRRSQASAVGLGYSGGGAAGAGRNARGNSMCIINNYVHHSHLNKHQLNDRNGANSRLSNQSSVAASMLSHVINPTGLLNAPNALAGSRKTSIFDPTGHSLVPQGHISRRRSTMVTSTASNGGSTASATNRLQQGRASMCIGPASGSKQRDQLAKQSIACLDSVTLSPTNLTMLNVAKLAAQTGSKAGRKGGLVKHVPVIGCSPTSIKASLSALDETRRYEKLLRRLERYKRSKKKRRDKQLEIEARKLGFLDNNNATNLDDEFVNNPFNDDNNREVDHGSPEWLERRHGPQTALGLRRKSIKAIKDLLLPSSSSSAKRTTTNNTNVSNYDQLSMSSMSLVGSMSSSMSSLDVYELNADELFQDENTMINPRQPAQPRAGADPSQPSNTGPQESHSCGKPPHRHDEWSSISGTEDEGKPTNNRKRSKIKSALSRFMHRIGHSNHRQRQSQANEPETKLQNLGYNSRGLRRTSSSRAISNSSSGRDLKSASSNVIHRVSVSQRSSPISSPNRRPSEMTRVSSKNCVNPVSPSSSLNMRRRRSMTISGGMNYLYYYYYLRENSVDAIDDLPIQAGFGSGIGLGSGSGNSSGGAGNTGFDAGAGAGPGSWLAGAPGSGSNLFGCSTANANNSAFGQDPTSSVGGGGVLSEAERRSRLHINYSLARINILNSRSDPKVKLANRMADLSLGQQQCEDQMANDDQTRKSPISQLYDYSQSSDSNSFSLSTSSRSSLCSSSTSSLNDNEAPQAVPGARKQDGDKNKGEDKNNERGPNLGQSQLDNHSVATITTATSTSFESSNNDYDVCNAQNTPSRHQQHHQLNKTAATTATMSVVDNKGAFNGATSGVDREFRHLHQYQSLSPPSSISNTGSERRSSNVITHLQKYPSDDRIYEMGSIKFTTNNNNKGQQMAGEQCDNNNLNSNNYNANYATDRRTNNKDFLFADSAHVYNREKKLDPSNTRPVDTQNGKASSQKQHHLATSWTNLADYDRSIENLDDFERLKRSHSTYRYRIAQQEVQKERARERERRIEHRRRSKAISAAVNAQISDTSPSTGKLRPAATGEQAAGGGGGTNTTNNNEDAVSSGSSGSRSSRFAWVHRFASGRKFSRAKKKANHLGSDPSLGSWLDDSCALVAASPETATGATSAPGKSSSRNQEVYNKQKQANQTQMHDPQMQTHPQMQLQMEPPTMVMQNNPIKPPLRHQPLYTTTTAPSASQATAPDSSPNTTTSNSNNNNIAASAANLTNSNSVAANNTINNNNQNIKSSTKNNNNNDNADNIDIIWARSSGSGSGAGQRNSEDVVGVASASAINTSQSSQSLAQNNNNNTINCNIDANDPINNNNIPLFQCFQTLEEPIHMAYQLCQEQTCSSSAMRIDSNDNKRDNNKNNLTCQSLSTFADGFQQQGRQQQKHQHETRHVIDCRQELAIPTHDLSALQTDGSGPDFMRRNYDDNYFYDVGGRISPGCSTGAPLMGQQQHQTSQSFQSWDTLPVEPTSNGQKGAKKFATKCNDSCRNFQSSSFASYGGYAAGSCEGGLSGIMADYNVASGQSNSSSAAYQVRPYRRMHSVSMRQLPGPTRDYYKDEYDHDYRAGLDDINSMSVCTTSNHNGAGGALLRRGSSVRHLSRRKKSSICGLSLVVPQKQQLYQTASCGQPDSSEQIIWSHQQQLHNQVYYQSESVVMMAAGSIQSSQDIRGLQAQQQQHHHGAGLSATNQEHEDFSSDYEFRARAQSTGARCRDMRPMSVCYEYADGNQLGYQFKPSVTDDERQRFPVLERKQEQQHEQHQQHQHQQQQRNQIGLRHAYSANLCNLNQLDISQQRQQEQKIQPSNIQDSNTDSDRKPHRVSRALSSRNLSSGSHQQDKIHKSASQDIRLMKDDNNNNNIRMDNDTNQEETLNVQTTAVEDVGDQNQQQEALRILEKSSFICTLIGSRQTGKRSIVKCLVKIVDEFKLAAGEYKREKILIKLLDCAERMQQLQEEREKAERQAEEERLAASARADRKFSTAAQWLAGEAMNKLLNKKQNSNTINNSKRRINSMALPTDGLAVGLSSMADNNATVCERNHQLRRHTEFGPPKLLIHASDDNNDEGHEQNKMINFAPQSQTTNCYQKRPLDISMNTCPFLTVSDDTSATCAGATGATGDISTSCVPGGEDSNNPNSQNNNKNLGDSDSQVNYADDEDDPLEERSILVPEFDHRRPSSQTITPANETSAQQNTLLGTIQNRQRARSNVNITLPLPSTRNEPRSLSFSFASFMGGQQDETPSNSPQSRASDVNKYHTHRHQSSSRADRLSDLRQLLNLKQLNRRRIRVKFKSRRQLSDTILKAYQSNSSQPRIDTNTGKDNSTRPSHTRNRNEHMSSKLPDCMIFVYAVNDRPSFEYAKMLIKRLKTTNVSGTSTAANTETTTTVFLQHSLLPMILVANKIDLERSKVVKTEEGRSLAAKYCCKFIEISCTIGFNLDNLLAGIRTQLILRHHLALNSIFKLQDTTRDHNDRPDGKQADDNRGFVRRFFRRYLADNDNHDNYDCDNFYKL